VAIDDLKEIYEQKCYERNTFNQQLNQGATAG
jgi:hypothetical protein